MLRQMPIYLDKKANQLFIQFDYKGQTYKRRLPKGTPKADAKKFEARWRNDLLNESFGFEKKKDILYEDFLADYFLPFAERHYSAEGNKNVIIICRASLPFLKGQMLRKISAADIEAFKKHRQKLLTKHGTKRKPSTIQRELNNISKIFSYAVKQDFLEYNPCSKVDRPPCDNIQDKILPFDKIELFLDNINSAWARDVAVLILNTGLRQNDALGLKKFNADFDNRTLGLIQGKNQRRVEIPMNDTVFNLLSSRWHNGSELFFPSPKTGKQGTMIKTALNAAGARCGLGKIGTRVLRRTFSTNLEELGFPASAIAKLLGHSDLRSVHRYQRGKEILREAVKSLDKEKTFQNPTALPFRRVAND
jgi:integrase